MEYFIGVVLAGGVGIFTTLLRMDRDRALYPAVLIVIAALYDLFAVMGGSSQALALESAVGVIFVGLAVAGFRSTLWFAVAGLAGHGIYDFVHGLLFQNPGVPTFWPMFCSAYDVTAAAYLAWLLVSNRVRATAT
jgi:hypothetical protein